MSKNIYFHLLFLCGILCQGIFATLLVKDTRLSSDILARKRRVINRLPSGRDSPRIESINYIVKIKELSRGICAGAILSHYTVITAASCITRLHTSAYKVLSGAASDKLFNYHNVSSKVSHYGNPPHKVFDGIALITVNPPFVFGSKTGYIQLYDGPINSGTLAAVAGWGFLHAIEPSTEHRQRLRAIALPIMNHEECQNIYRNHFPITAKHICTYHEQQCCARNDEGAPLILGYKLAGIHVWKGEIHGQRNPDVFIDLQRPDYRQWIRDNTLL